MILQEWAEAQKADTMIDQIIKLYQGRGIQTTKVGGEAHQEVKQFMRQSSQFKLCQGVLYHKIGHIRQDHNYLQLVLPEKYRKKAMQGCHDDLGHLGVGHRIDLLQDRFLWPSMYVDSQYDVQNCD